MVRLSFKSNFIYLPKYCFLFRWWKTRIMFLQWERKYRFAGTMIIKNKKEENWNPQVFEWSLCICHWLRHRLHLSWYAGGWISYKVVGGRFRYGRGQRSTQCLSVPSVFVMTTSTPVDYVTSQRDTLTILEKTYATVHASPDPFSCSS